MSAPLVRRHFRVRGIVQGVGFRPFVFGLAQRHGLTGHVGNDASGVFIEVQGAPEAIAGFHHDLKNQPPPLAVIDEVVTRDIPPREESGFVIVTSRNQLDARTPVSPDIATCADCLRELFDPADRRYRYPFINCTNCGPRFTILRELPYDRPRTTMAGFPMCPACDREYHDPTNRRFHAQPNACPVCGPRIWWVPAERASEALADAFDFTPWTQAEAALKEAQQALAAGRIVAVKGVGGFHLACDATSAEAVALLRRRKARGDKPFALMAKSLEQVRMYVDVDAEEERLLTGKERPIVLLKRREAPAAARPLAAGVAPGNAFVGFMLPYSPLHHLLLEDRPLVMTSGNLSDEPIARDNAEALARLATLADAFLLHDRPIHVVCDDSVIRVFEGHEAPVRRSRGFAPFPVAWPGAGPTILAVGAELKATFCLAQPPYAFESQHIGDMGNLETLAAFERAVAHFQKLYRAEPALLACDLHPDYLSTRWAERFAVRAV